MLQNNDAKSKYKYFFLKPICQVDKKDVNPHFEVRTKEGDKYEVQQNKPTKVSGKLVKVKGLVKELSDKKVKLPCVQVTLEDPETQERYLLDLTFKLTTRSLLNAIMSAKLGSDIVISYYRNKKGYDSFWVADSNDNKIEWKYSLQELPQPQEVVIRGVPSKDFYEMDMWFIDKVNELFAENSVESRKEAF